MAIPIAVLVAINVIAGAANALIASVMNKISAPPGFGLPSETFSHPFVQTLVMMFGLCFCLLVFAVMYWRSTPEGPSPWHRGQLLFAIPCCFDWGGSTMMYAALLDIPTSQVQVLRGSLVIFVFLISIFILRNKQQDYQYVGVLLVVVGITCVGCHAILSDVETFGGEGRAKNPVRGVAIALCGQMLAAMMMTSEEKLFRKFETPAILAIGVEGVCGVLFGIVVLTVTYYLGIERPGEAAYQISHSRSLLAISALLCGSIAAFNCSGIKITKATSATSRCTIDGVRTFVVWIVDLALNWAPREYWTFAFWLQPIGFCISITGSLIYFNAIPLSFKDDEKDEPGYLQLSDDKKKISFVDRVNSRCNKAALVNIWRHRPAATN